MSEERVLELRLADCERVGFLYFLHVLFVFVCCAYGLIRNGLVCML